MGLEMSGGTTGSGLVGGAGSLSPSGGSSGSGTAAGPTALAPNGGVGRTGVLVPYAMTPHAHEDTTTGGVIDYARVVISPTAPPAPASPSDAFWLNPTEEA